MESREQSDFNMAVSYLGRMNTLFYLATQAALDYRAQSWLDALAALHRELSTEQNPEEREHFKKTIMQLNDVVAKIEKKNARKGINHIPTDVYNQLSDFEMQLRRILKEAGLQQRVMDTAAKALR